MLEQHPPHVRRKIALFVTLGVAVVLIATLIVVYVTRSKKAVKGEGESKLSQFYKTILEDGQSLFRQK